MTPRIRALLALAAASCNAAVWASPVASSSTGITLRMTGFSNGYAAVDTSLNDGYIGAGRLQGLWTQGGVATSFLTYCTDIYQGFAWNTNYSYTLVGTDTANGLTTRQEDLMGKLYTLAGSTVNSTDTSAAFQLAVWEIVNETSPTLDVGSGFFRLEAGGTAIQRNLANGWLASTVDPLAGKAFSATRLYNNLTQDFVVFNPIAVQRTVSGTTTSSLSIPEPGGAALTVLALAGIFLTRRRESRHAHYRAAPAGA